MDYPRENQPVQNYNKNVRSTGFSGRSNGPNEEYLTFNSYLSNRDGEVVDSVTADARPKGSWNFEQQSQTRNFQSNVNSRSNWGKSEDGWNQQGKGQNHDYDYDESNYDGNLNRERKMNFDSDYNSNYDYDDYSSNLDADYDQTGASNYYNPNFWDGNGNNQRLPQPNYLSSFNRQRLQQQVGISQDSRQQNQWFPWNLNFNSPKPNQGSLNNHHMSNQFNQPTGFGPYSRFNVASPNFGGINSAVSPGSKTKKNTKKQSSNPFIRMREFLLSSGEDEENEKSENEDITDTIRTEQPFNQASGGSPNIFLVMNNDGKNFNIPSSQAMPFNNPNSSPINFDQTKNGDSLIVIDVDEMTKLVDNSDDSVVYDDDLQPLINQRKDDVKKPFDNNIPHTMPRLPHMEDYYGSLGDQIPYKSDDSNWSDQLDDHSDDHYSHDLDYDYDNYGFHSDEGKYGGFYDSHSHKQPPKKHYGDELDNIHIRFPKRVKYLKGTIKRIPKNVGPYGSVNLHNGFQVRHNIPHKHQPSYGSKPLPLPPPPYGVGLSHLLSHGPGPKPVLPYGHGPKTLPPYGYGPTSNSHGSKTMKPYGFRQKRLPSYGPKTLPKIRHPPPYSIPHGGPYKPNKPGNGHSLIVLENSFPKLPNYFPREPVFFKDEHEFVDPYSFKEPSVKSYSHYAPADDHEDVLLEYTANKKEDIKAVALLISRGKNHDQSYIPIIGPGTKHVVNVKNRARSRIQKRAFDSAESHGDEQLKLFTHSSRLSKNLDDSGFTNRSVEEDVDRLKRDILEGKAKKKIRLVPSSSFSSLEEWTGDEEIPAKYGGGAIEE